MNVLVGIKKIKREQNPRNAAKAMIKKWDTELTKKLDLGAQDDVPPSNLDFKDFTTYRMEEMSDRIDAFITTLSLSGDERDVFKMLLMIKSRLPWSLVKPFFREFDVARRGSNILPFFDKFYYRPDVQEKIHQMRQMIKQREFNSKRVVIKRPPRLKDVVDRITSRYPRPAVVNAPPRHRFGPGEFMSKCEREYRRAPWMHRFTDEPIRGFVITPHVDLVKYITTKYDDTWFNVSTAWYKDACAGKRQYVENAVGYTAVSGRIIVETLDMFDASGRAWKEILDAEFQPVTADSISVAQTMLEQNEILPKDDIQGVLASLNTSTNHDMARGLSKVLVYLQPLIKGPHVHHFRVQNSYYNPEDLVKLDRYTVLPEIYKNPDVDHAEAKLAIKQRRRLIENDFYEMIKNPHDPFIRRGVTKKQTAVKYIQTAAREACPLDIDDVIYYTEDNKLYCFDRMKIGQNSVNPFTGKPFSHDFLNELDKIKGKTVQIYPPPIVNLPPRTYPVKMPKKRIGFKETDLAPGLFQKLKIMVSTIRCNQCDKEIYAPRFKSFAGNEKVYFCSRDCFNEFEFPH